MYVSESQSTTETFDKKLSFEADLNTIDEETGPFGHTDHFGSLKNASIIEVQPKM